MSTGSTEAAAATAATAPFTIRPARPEDDAAIGELLVDAFVARYAQKLPEVQISPSRRQALRAVADKRAVATVLVAEQEGRVVGTVALFPPGAPDSQAFIPGAADLRHLALDPALHGRGLSGRLLDPIEHVARTWGVSAICLHVRRGAHGLGRMYERRGYARVPAGDVDKLPEVFLEAWALQLRP